MQASRQQAQKGQHTERKRGMQVCSTADREVCRRVGRETDRQMSRHSRYAYVRTEAKVGFNGNIREIRGIKSLSECVSYG